LINSKILFRIIASFVILIGITEGFLWINLDSHSSGTELWDIKSTPEEQGLDATKIKQIINWIKKENYAIDSLIVISRGEMVVEEYFSLEEHLVQTLSYKDKKHEIASCTKSIISTLIGICIREGFIKSIDERVVDFFPDKTISNLDSRKQSMTIEHLLTMTTGLDWLQYSSFSSDHGSTSSDTRMKNSPNWVQFVLDQPMISNPGETFVYCNGASHLLSAIIERTSGQSTLEFAKKYLFGPLGIIDVFWPKSKGGIYYGGGGMRLRSRDMAKFGYLYCNNGTWIDGRQIIPAEWVVKSTNTSVLFSGDSGYGFQFWTCPQSNFFYAWGAGYQRIFVAPQHDLVVVFTADIFTPNNPIQGLFLHLLSATNIQETNSNYGFSFNYSTGIIVTERIDIFPSISNSSGRIDTNTPAFPILKYSVMWDAYENSPDLTNILSDYWLNFESRNPLIVITKRENQISSMKENHLMKYQVFEWNDQETSFPGVISCWYCEESSRVYTIAYFDLDIDLVENSLEFIDSFICH
jgi:CubicO group peptidase (beta-lactamase class C family)